MLDHVTIGVADLAASVAFYDRTLGPLGIVRVSTDGMRFAGYGANGAAFFWIGVKPQPLTGTHVAFAAANRGLVDVFHAAALEAGGRDNGAPGLRPQYHTDYYGAFVLDPDGHNVEAVCRRPD